MKSNYEELKRKFYIPGGKLLFKFWTLKHTNYFCEKKSDSNKRLNKKITLTHLLICQVSISADYFGCHKELTSHTFSRHQTPHNFGFLQLM